MIIKTALENIIASQRRMVAECPNGQQRDILSEMPYLTDKALILGGIRGCGRSTTLIQMMRAEYPTAWYTNFEDPRLAGFDLADFQKLDALIEESGKGVILLDKADMADGWQDFVLLQLKKGYKVVATLSLSAFNKIRRSEDQSIADHFIAVEIFPFSYSEYLAVNRRSGGENDINDYIAKGALPEQIKTAKIESLYDIYSRTVALDIILAKGVRDHAALQRTALHLISMSGEAVTANNLRSKLKIKAVSTLVEYFDHIDQAGLINFVPIFSDSTNRRSINPRKIYPSDTALAVALSLKELDRSVLFETMIFNHLRRSHSDICYTSSEGGCNFIVKNESGAVTCIQACYDGDDIDDMQAKTEGIVAAIKETAASKAIIVTLSNQNKIDIGDFEIEVIDADTFMS